MDPDTVFVFGLVLGVLSIPAVVSAISDGRAPRAVEVSVWFGRVDGAVAGEPSRPADRRRLVPVFGADDGDDALAQRAVGSSGLSRSSSDGAS